MPLQTFATALADILSIVIVKAARKRLKRGRSSSSPAAGSLSARWALPIEPDVTNLQGGSIIQQCQSTAAMTHPGFSVRDESRSTTCGPSMRVDSLILLVPKGDEPTSPCKAMAGALKTAALLQHERQRRAAVRPQPLQGGRRCRQGIRRQCHDQSDAVAHTWEKLSLPHLD